MLDIHTFIQMSTYMTTTHREVIKHCAPNNLFLILSIVCSEFLKCLKITMFQWTCGPVLKTLIFEGIYRFSTDDRQSPE